MFRRCKPSMATGGISQVVAIVIALRLALSTAMCMQPKQVRSGIKTEADNGIDKMLEAMDMSVRPCDNFYNYACGGWMRHHPIPDDATYIETLTIMDSELSNKLRGLLDEIESGDSEAVIKAKTFYRSCLNEPLIESRGSEPLINLLNEEFGGWPLLGSHSSVRSESVEGSSSIGGIGNNKWVQLMANLTTYNNWIIILQTVDLDREDSSKHAILLYPAKLGLPSTDYYHFGSPQLKAYAKFIMSTAKMLKANNPNLVSDIGQILEFESELANILKDYERRGATTYVSMNMMELKTKTPAIDWSLYFKYAFPDLVIDGTEKIGIYGLNYLEEISKLIERTASERTIVNYLLWRFVMNRMHNLGGPFAEASQKFDAELTGVINQTPRHKLCVNYLKGFMEMAISSLYIKHHFHRDSKLQAMKIASDIRQAFMEILQEVSWMDDWTRSLAFHKARSIIEQIGYPEWILNSAQLDQEYENLNIGVGSHFENIIQFLRFLARGSQSKLRKPSDRNKWTVAPGTINAYYSPSANLISLPAGILQSPIYNYHYPKSFNYGSIGFIIGHELSHGFDADGQLYDHLGNRDPWWLLFTANEFKKRTQCMIDQYNAYKVELGGGNVVKVNGARTLGENVADNAGVKAAFRAYLSYEQKEGYESPLPGIGLTHHQMFFIKFAQNLCQNMNPQSTMITLKTWPHPPNEFRVIGTLTNMNEFSEAFNCPVGSSMNPRNKCHVW